MYLYHALILTLFVITSTLADDSITHGVPANGVTCATAKETLHILDDSTLTNAITQGASNVYITSTSAYGSQNIFYPQKFDGASLGTDPNGHTYNINYADGCDPSQGLYYMPVAYPGYSAPAYTGHTLPAMLDPPAPALPVSSDIVLFTVSLPNQEVTTSLIGRFCAVLTNSDSDPEGALYVSRGGSLLQNTRPKGYHQCNSN